MSLEKKVATFKKAAELKKKTFDGAVEFYNSKSFKWIEYSKQSVLNKTSKITSAVYIFIVRNPSTCVKKILTSVGDIKRIQKNNKLPKLNANYKDKESFKENGCLYIGSITSEILEKRIKQHWRENDKDVSDSTYALKLCDWINDAKISEKDVMVYFCDMTGQKREIIRVIEDLLATMYSPLLGKRGDSSKG